MHRTILSVFLLTMSLAAARLDAGINYWSPIGPYGGQMLALAADPQQSEVVYAGSYGGVFKSIDGGATWRRTSRGLEGLAVYALAVAPSNRNVIYAGGDGLFVSRDGGETWQGPLLANAFVLALAVDPRDARRVWAGTDNNVAWSRDGGKTWSVADSTDEGGILRVPAIAIDPVHPDTVYAFSRPLEDQDILKVIKTTNGGATWTQSKGLESEAYSYDSLRLAVDPTAPNVVYASLGLFFDEGVTYRSADGGATWQRTPGTYPLAVDRKGVVYAGRMRSGDHGVTWQTAAAPPGFTVEYAASAAGDGALWAATDLSGVFRSGDRAATWQASSEGLAATSVSAVAVDPERPRVIYAGSYELGVRKTLSSGLRWRDANSGLPFTARLLRPRYLIAVDPRQPQTVYLAWSGGLARSDDGGARWTVLIEGGGDPHSLVVGPAGVVYLSGSSLLDGKCRLARSDDHGATFRCLPPFNNAGGFPPPVRLAVDPARPSTLWVAETRDRVWKSVDGGEHWTEIRPRGLRHAGEPRSLAIDPSQPRRLYLGTDRSRPDDRPERVWRSDDGGVSWRPWGKGMPESSWITDLLIDPQQPSLLYLSVWDQSGSASGVYQSRDGGRTFTPVRDGLPGRVLHLILDPQDSRKLYAGTEWTGVYTFTRK
jgi:photosystem II stability/assembly factor-like uncharacterized protein